MFSAKNHINEGTLPPITSTLPKARFFVMKKFAGRHRKFGLLSPFIGKQYGSKFTHQT